MTRLGRGLRAAAITLGLMALAVPVAIVLTILLLPLWRWVEATWQIESVGHSGPADWCFVAVYVLCLAAMGTAWALGRRAGGPAVPGRGSEGK